VIGAAGVDMVGRSLGEVQPGASSPAHIRSSFGGVARNVAENLARLGQPVRLLTAVGEDGIGEQLLQQAAAAGVEVSAARRTSRSPTGSYLAVVSAEGALQLALDDMRAIAALTPGYLEQHAALFKDASLLFVDANLSPRALAKAISLARRAHLPVCADPTSAALATRLRTHLSKLSLVTPNYLEAGLLCQRPATSPGLEEALDRAKCLVTQGAEIALVSLAEFGVCYATSQISGHVPAVRVEIVDPTGGGDALTAAVIFALLNQIPLDDAVRLGVSAAALTLRHSGSVVPDLTLEKLYDRLVI
jgi:pseudouridine kinase